MTDAAPLMTVAVADQRTFEIGIGAPVDPVKFEFADRTVRLHVSFCLGEAIVIVAINELLAGVVI